MINDHIGIILCYSIIVEQISDFFQMRIKALDHSSFAPSKSPCHKKYLSLHVDDRNFFRHLIVPRLHTSGLAEILGDSRKVGQRNMANF